MRYSGSPTSLKKSNSIQLAQNIFKKYFFISHPSAWRGRMSRSSNLNLGSTLRCSNLWYFVSPPFCSADTVAARARNTLAISNIAAVQCCIVSMSVGDDYFRCNKRSVAYRDRLAASKCVFGMQINLQCHWGRRSKGNFYRTLVQVPACQ